MQIGQYVIEQPNDGSTKIHPRNTRLAYMVPIERLIKEYIHHIDTLKSIFHKIEVSFLTGSNDILTEDPLIMELVEIMTPDEIVPGETLNEEQTKYFTKNMMLIVYNRMHKTSLLMKEILS